MSETGHADPYTRIGSIAQTLHTLVTGRNCIQRLLPPFVGIRVPLVGLHKASMYSMEHNAQQGSQYSVCRSLVKLLAPKVLDLHAESKVTRSSHLSGAYMAPLLHV